ncbi:zinc finger MYM-type protein 1-like [Aphis craccivora]|uniref:Zinc finger MYM-type protein 1-like n=1 Tax=Aphis craccivora TaxID=307492 RepID=A0A6G0VJJ8_APHCR|nr:zinc finger MYM-type protein 1-like [Aphis craccivora]
MDHYLIKKKTNEMVRYLVHSSEPVNTDISQPSTSSTSLNCLKNTAISEQNFTFLACQCMLPNVIDPRNNDIGLFVNANGSLTDEQKHLILVKPWIPPSTYAFPILDQNKKRKLKFQHQWFNTENGAFCKFCLVFATTGGVGQQKLGALTNKAFTNWKNAKEKFNEHASFDYHNLSVTKAEDFLSIYSNKTPSIITALDNDRLDSWNNFNITIIFVPRMYNRTDVVGCNFLSPKNTVMELGDVKVLALTLVDHV